MIVVTEPELAATEFWTRLSEAQREELRAVLRACGGDPSRTHSLRCEIVDMPLLRATEYLHDDEGNRYCSTDGELATAYVDYALRVPLPAWWRPNPEGATQ